MRTVFRKLTLLMAFLLALTFFACQSNSIPDIVTIQGVTYSREPGGDTFTVIKMDKEMTEGEICSDYLGLAVTEIDDLAFNGCTNLKSVQIPDSVTRIGYKAFNSCTRLQKVVIPNSVLTISSWAFANCHRLTEIVIPSSVTTIGSNAFMYTSLTHVYYTGTEEEWNALQCWIPSSATVHFNFTP